MVVFSDLLGTRFLSTSCQFMRVDDARKGRVFVGAKMLRDGGDVKTTRACVFRDRSSLLGFILDIRL
jgi:hypothetical protein